MSEAPCTRNLTLPPALVVSVDHLCDCFEAAWKVGSRPRIEEYLARASEAARTLLLHELLKLEWWYRSRSGERPTREEYEQRFSEYAELIHVAFTEEAGAAAQPAEAPSPGHSVETGREQTVAAGVAVPARLGRYRVTAQLGSGGFGVVYKGYDEELRRDVAIKLPHRHRITCPADIETYLAEARILASLDHPGIVPVHDVGRTP